MSERVRIRFLDTITGDVGEYRYDTERLLADDPDDDEGFYWTDGNGACDCERMRILRAVTDGGSDQDAPCGDSRVRIIEAWRGNVRVPWDDMPNV